MEAITEVREEKRKEGFEGGKCGGMEMMIQFWTC